MEESRPPFEIAKYSYAGIHNRSDLEKSMKCGCYHCLRIFEPKDIRMWVDTKKDTALCPHCGIDAVVGDAAVSVELKDLSSVHSVMFKGL